VKLNGGITSFQVDISTTNISDTTKEVISCKEVLQRICLFCETFKDIQLSCSGADEGATNSTITVYDGDDPNEENTNTIHPRQFLIDISVMTTSSKKDGKMINVDDTTSNNQNKNNYNSTVVVAVDMTSYAHTTKGIHCVRKIQNQIKGEVSRTNRRWRRKEMKE